MEKSEHAKETICIFIGDAWPEWIAVNFILPRLYRNGIRAIVVLVSPRRGKSTPPKEIEYANLLEKNILWQCVVPILDSLCEEEISEGSCVGPAHWASRWETTFLKTDLPNDLVFIEKLAEYQPVLGISIRPVSIFNSKLIDFFHAEKRHGFWNVHPAKLPNYRGVKPLFQVMVRGEKQTTLTLHHIDEGVDTGEIILEQAVAFGKNQSLFANYVGIGVPMGKMVTEVASKVLTGDDIKSYRQDNSSARYFTFPDDAQLQVFKELGHRLIASDDFEKYSHVLVKIKDQNRLERAIANMLNEHISRFGTV